MLKKIAAPGSGYYRPEDCDAAALEALITAKTEPEDTPKAQRIEKRIPIYSGELFREAETDAGARQALMSELNGVLSGGAGVFVIKGAFEDTAPIDAANSVIEDIIAREKAAGTAAGDHFAKPGANDRIWNALEKLCLAAPDVFADYYQNSAVAIASEAWLGPNYQVTSQVNIVNPGGAAQTAHRDYHLGFGSAENAMRYPVTVHHLSPHLTLQGAVAHSDMPVESGPTMLLPFSQTWGPGYVGFHQSDVQDLFNARHVQLPLKKGDAVFFNPALLHAAGTNRTQDIRRSANLLQISSAFGRAMEAVNRRAMIRALYPALLNARDRMTRHGLFNAIAAAAEGYAFPADLDRNPPQGGGAPQSDAEFLLASLDDGTGPEEFNRRLDQRV